MEYVMKYRFKNRKREKYRDIQKQLFDSTERIEKFAKQYLLLISKTSDDYVSGVKSMNRIILVTMSRLFMFITSLRFFLIAIINKVINSILYL